MLSNVVFLDISPKEFVLKKSNRVIYIIIKYRKDMVGVLFSIINTSVIEYCSKVEIKKYNVLQNRIPFNIVELRYCNFYIHWICKFGNKSIIKQDLKNIESVIVRKSKAYND